MNFVLSSHPLSRKYIEALEKKVGFPLNAIELLSLRQRGIIGLIKALRATRGVRAYVAYEDASTIAILPLLLIAAAFTRVRDRFAVNEDLQVLKVRRLHAAQGLVGVFGASLAAFIRCGLSMLGAWHLASRPRVAVNTKGRRVLYLDSNLWFGLKAGGSVGHISGVANGFLAEGYEVLFCSVGGRLMVDHRIPHKKLKSPTSFGMPWIVNTYSLDYSIARQATPVIRDFGPAFIYQRMSAGNYSGVRLSRRFRIPLVLEYNGSEAWIARNWGKALPLEAAAIATERVCLRHAHLIVTVSEALRDELHARGVEESRVAMYPNCVDPQIFNPVRFSKADSLTIRQRHGIEPDATVVAFIGSFGQWHGVPVLAAVIRDMVNRESAWLDQHKVRFLLIGDGAKMPDVRAILGSHAESKYVRLTGLIPQEQAPAHLAASDILSSPHVANADGSRFFGSPTKLFEYMAMGKAIVASDLDQIGVVLSNSIRVSDLPHIDAAANPLAVLCKAGSVEEHAAGIRFLVSNPDWRRRLGEHAHAEALAKYTWTHHVRRIVDRLGGITQ